MRVQVEYHRAMRYWVPVLAVSLWFTVSASAQINGVPPSVTSVGLGGHPGPNGVPPSVTSYGFGGHPGFNGVPPSVTSFGFGSPRRPFRPGPRIPRHHHSGYVYPYYIPYYVPYYPADAYDDSVADQGVADPQEDPEQDQGGPTIFDRRGPGERAPNDYDAQSRKSNVPRPPAPVAAELTASAATKAPEPSIAVQPTTILIFKDGHKQEVSNYAIVGTNLFDLTPGHRLKITLSDLDVVATQKANDDQGIDFKLPEMPNGN